MKIAISWKQVLVNQGFNYELQLQIIFFLFFGSNNFDAWLTSSTYILSTISMLFN